MRNYNNNNNKKDFPEFILYFRLDYKILQLSTEFSNL